MVESKVLICRSNDCRRIGRFLIVMRAETGKVSWSGAFCQRHLVRCMALKMRELELDQTMVIRRINGRKK